MSKVKVTNITNKIGTRGPSSGINVDFLGVTLKPGQDTIVSVDKLPSDWKTMKDAFEFEFIADSSSVTNQTTVINQNVDVTLLQELIAQVKDIANQQQTPSIVNEPSPSMDMSLLQQMIAQGIKDGIAEGMKNVKPSTTIINQGGGSAGNFGNAGIGQASFIPEIKDVKDASNLTKESEVVEGPKKDSLKEKLKRLNRGV